MLIENYYRNNSREEYHLEDSHRKRNGLRWPLHRRLGILYVGLRFAVE